MSDAMINGIKNSVAVTTSNVIPNKRPVEKKDIDKFKKRRKKILKTLESEEETKKMLHEEINKRKRKNV